MTLCLIKFMVDEKTHVSDHPTVNKNTYDSNKMIEKNL